MQRGGSSGNLTPVVKWLLMLNAAVFLIDMLLERSFGVRFGQIVRPPLRVWGAFSVESAVYQGRVWEFLTFQFLHGGWGHIFFNSLGLYFFGPWMERWWGARRFLMFYLLCGVGGALFYTLLVVLNVLPSAFLVGASAGIYGILIGVAVVAPNLRARLLFPPIELSMRQLAIVILSIAAGSILLRVGGNEGGEAGHLGGAIMGFFLIKFPFLLGAGKPVFPFRKRSYETKIKPRTTVDFSSDSEVDAVLDKISREGFQSLTPEDHAVLQRAREKADR